MFLESAHVDKDHVVVVICGLKAIQGSLTLKRYYKTHSLEALRTDEQGHQHPVNFETLQSLKPEISKWLDGMLSKSIQKFVSKLGAHVRVTKDQDDALLLLDLYREIISEREWNS